MNAWRPVSPVRVSEARLVQERAMRIARAYTGLVLAVLATGQRDQRVRLLVEDAIDQVQRHDEGAPLWEIGVAVADVLAAVRLVSPRPPLPRPQAAACGRAALRLSHRHETVKT